MNYGFFTIFAFNNKSVFQTDGILFQWQYFDTNLYTGLIMYIYIYNKTLYHRKYRINHITSASKVSIGLSFLPHKKTQRFSEYLETKK